jgi:hypothetical protein
MKKLMLLKLKTRIVSIAFVVLAITNLKAQDDCFNTIVGTVNEDSVAAIIQHLESYESRFMLNPNRLEIANWIKSKMESFGLSEVRIDTFETHVDHPNENIDTVVIQYNVVGVINGSGAANEKILIGAHYDSFSTDTDPLVIAPGADDNASGVASVLECARALSSVDCTIPQTVEFVAFAAEEFMLHCTSGSEYHASQVAENGDSIVLMINNDMIGYNGWYNTISFSNYPSRQLATNLAILSCQTFTELNYTLWPSTWTAFADVQPFFHLGAPVVYMEETFFSPFYHTSNDVIGNIDLSYCTEVVRCALGTIVLFDEHYLSGESPKINDVIIYPNPVKNFMQIDIGSEGIINSLQICNLNGQILEEVENLENNILDLSGLDMGMYLLRIQTWSGLYTAKFIKQD